MNKTISTLIFALFLSLIIKPVFANDVDLQKLENYYLKSMQQWDVPGIAVGIVKDNALVFAKGLGLKDINKTDKIDQNTNFAIASNSKAFTSAGIMMLQAEGKLSLDDNVKKHLPWFQLYDEYVSDNMTIRDLLCHRSGLVTFSGDLIWYASDHSPEEVVKRARYLKPHYGFREAYGYSNVMYLAAGLIIEKVSGQAWEEFMQQRFFNPLKMNRTITSINDIKKTGNYTEPHIEKDKKIISIPYVNWDNAKAMGGIISNVTDVSQWLKLHLNHGVVDGDTLFTKKMQEEMWEMHTIRSVSKTSKELWPSTHFKGYGLGWGLFNYQGRKVIMHTGGYDGTITATVLVPEEKLGIVILTNKITSLYSPILYRTLDAFFGLEEQDWSSKIYDKFHQEEEEKTRSFEEEIPAMALKHYTGKYAGIVYGGLNVSIKNQQLYISFDHTKMFHGFLRHLNSNIFEIEFKEAPSLPKGTVEFVLNEEKEVTELIIDIPNPDFDFTELDFKKQ